MFANTNITKQVSVFLLFKSLENIYRIFNQKYPRDPKCLTESKKANQCKNTILKYENAKF